MNLFGYFVYFYLKSIAAVDEYDGEGPTQDYWGLSLEAEGT